MKYLRPSIVLFIVAILAYGLLIPQLGFYWDDLPISWISYQLGPQALAQYFASSRPLWGKIFEMTSHIFPQVPIYWQMFALLWRWLGAAVVYEVVKKLWRDKPRMALGVALIFLVYPGFNQHFAAFLYSHFYIVLFFLLFSFLSMLQAMDSPKRYWAWTVAGMISSALNLFVMEYFFVPELARVGIILVAIRDEKLSFRERIIRTLKLWTPYLAVFALGVLSRMFISNNQDYGMVVLDQLKTAPMEAIKSLAGTILFSLRLVLMDAWSQTLVLPNVALNPSVMTSYYVIVAITVLVASSGFVFGSPRDTEESNRKNMMDALWFMGLGVLAVLLAGWPFWLINFPASLEWPASRFTLPFIFGVSLIFGGLIGLIPWERMRIVLLVSLISLAVGKQYLTAQDYRQDWSTQKDLFWQMTWRAPGIKPGTMILLNEGALNYYADNSLSAALNWIYAPDNHSSQIGYLLFYPRTRLRNALPKLEPDIPIYYNYEAGEFHGNTAQTLAMYYAPPGCLRILDPDVERVNRLIPETSLMRFASRLTVPQLVLNEPIARMPDVYGPEPKHDFCYYFQKADLARQFGDWDTVVKMSEVALSFKDHPFDPAEQMVFIEGYAHAGQWGRAVELSRQVHKVSEDVVGQMLCRLWGRVEAETAQSPERSVALKDVKSAFGCNP